MTDLTADKIKKILNDIIDVNTGASILESLDNIVINENQITINIILSYPANSYHQVLSSAIKDALPDTNIIINISTKISIYKTQTGVDKIPGVKNIIAIASGKGGVGKSTVSVNLALALQAEGAKVAILDADIYGPSQPRMLGAKDLKPKTDNDGKLIPITAHNIQSMSIGYLVEEDTPMVWRGPMITQALEQMLRNTVWSDIDYMIIDLPPGTGDTQLTLSQKIPVSGSIIVTTPQDIALIDAIKGLKMFEKVNIPILGIIENMSGHVCPNCSHEENIFGIDGGKNMAQKLNVNFLGALPLNIDIRINSDTGVPIVIKDANGKIAQKYKKIANKLAAILSKQDKSIGAFPEITIE